MEEPSSPQTHRPPVSGMHVLVGVNQRKRARRHVMVWSEQRASELRKGSGEDGCSQDVQKLQGVQEPGLQLVSQSHPKPLEAT